MGDRDETAADAGRGAGSWVVDLALLAVLCGVAYLMGLDRFGPANWQESQRAVVAREMHGRGEWLVPTVNGRPYLAKPPMVYWATMGVAEIRGTRAGLWELRFVVGVAGVLGVLATYVVARRWFAWEDSARWARTGAMATALGLAGGVLYARSSRVGELDILLVPWVVVGVGAIAHAWRMHAARGRVAWGALMVAGIAGAGAALTKGPPGLLVLGLGGYGGMVLTAASRRAEGPNRWRGAAIGTGAVLGGAAAVAAFVRREAGDGMASSAIGAVMIGGLVGGAVVLAGRLLNGGRARELWAGLRGTHPVIVLGAAVVPLLAWGWMVRQRIGEGAGVMAADEAEDNLRVLVAESPLNNLEAAAYGVGLGSIGAIACVIWLWKDRPRVRRAWWFVFAWAGLSIAAMSLLGKGVGRYLTPAWPAIAMMGGIYFATLVSGAKRARAIAWVSGGLAAAMVLGQGWWYGYGREAYRAEQTPRPLLRELAARHGVDMSRLTTLNFRTPAIDYEVGSWVQPVGEIGMRESIAGGAPWTIGELVADLSTNGARTILVRKASAAEGDATWAQLREAGISVEALPTERVFLISGYRSPVIAARISAR